MNLFRKFFATPCKPLAAVLFTIVLTPGEPAEAQCAVCEMNLLEGTLDGDCFGGEYIDYEPPTPQASGFFYTAGRITPDPVGGTCRTIRIEVVYSGTPEGWTVDICDSHSCNGYGGDGGDTNWAAELEILNESYRVYSAQTDEVSVERIVDAQALKLTDDRVEFVIEDQRATMRYRDVSLVATTLNNEFLFDLSDRETQYGPPNHDIYASFNGVLTGSPSRVGEGASRVRITVE